MCVCVADQVSKLENELKEFKTDSLERNRLSSSESSDLQNSNNITNHIDTNMSSNNLKEEIERLKGG